MAKPPKHESALMSFVVVLLSCAALAAVILGLTAYALFAPSSPLGPKQAETLTGPPIATTTTVPPCPPGKTEEPAIGVLALASVYGVRPDGTVCIPTALLHGDP